MGTNSAGALCGAAKPDSGRKVAPVANELAGKKILFLAANEGVEQVELTCPWQAVREAGGQPLLAAPEPGKSQAFNHLDKADTFDVDLVTAGLRVDDYDGIVLPGGVANPDRLRTDPNAVRFVREFFASGKPAAVICHGPWTLVEADVVRDRRLTSWPSLRTDIRNAGGHWVDEPVVECGHGPNLLISSRKPDDLHAFCAALIRNFARPAHQAA
jgi:protease I